MSIQKICTQKEPPQYYRIGIFAQMNRTTIKALRHYDEIGLLKPEYVDESNGYRYYTSKQLPQLHQIIALKEFGFSLEEIHEILEGENEQLYLQKKKHQLLKEISKLTDRIASIESYLMKEDKEVPSHVIMKPLPEITIAYMRVQLTGYSQLFDVMPAMGIEMEKVGCECVQPDNCFTIYYDEGYKENDIQVDICQGVVDAKPSTETLKFKTLPKVETAACVLHRGPYETLPKSYAAIVQYIEENGYEIIGYQREAYIDGIWNKDDPANWLTEIQFPVKKREEKI